MGTESGCGVPSRGVFCLGCLAIVCSANAVGAGSLSAGGDSTANVLFPYLLHEYLPTYHIFAVLATVLCCAGAVWGVSAMRVGGWNGSRSSSAYRAWSRKKQDVTSSKLSPATSGGIVNSSYEYFPSAATNGLGDSQHLEKYSSMVEDLVPEITQHALSYLDYQSLCQVSKTNSAMRRVADDDSAWRALYRKDFSSEQDSFVPRNGWKAYYAVTKAVSRANKNFYQKFKAKSLRGMKSLWLKADYVKCIHPGGELLSGYDLVMENWRTVFNWSQCYDFELEDIRIRVVGDVAWVTAKEFINSSRHPLVVTNCYEFHDDQWYIVHHHSSLQMEGGVADYGLFV
ncbi:unnamed protein product [Calypogeia fissa]